MRVYLVAQTVENPPAVQETRVQSLGQEGLLERGMATLSSILTWIIPWTGEAGGLRGVTELDMIEQLTLTLG